MANPIGEAFVTLRPDLSKFTGEAGAALSSSLAGIGGKFSSAGRLFTAGVTAPIVGGFVLASKAAIDFESAYAGVQSKVQGTPEQLQAIADGARAMSKELPTSAVDILNVAKSAGQLGIATDDVLGFTKVVLQLAQTTNLTAEEAGSGMARIANILGLGGKSFENLGSTILSLGNIGASTERDIVEMALRIAGAGKVVGLSAPEVLAFANALSTVGLDAEAGGTAISRAFVEMANAVAGLKPTEEQLQAIATAQRAVRDGAQNLVTANRGVRDANENVESSYRGVAEANRGIQRANETLADAYRNLARAQRDQTTASFEARRETLSVAQAQQRLAELQARGPAAALELRDAQLAIAEAEKRLQEARSAGSREVAEAQRRLTEAQAQGGKNTTAIANAQRALNEARSKDHSLEIARAEQTLASARQRANELVVDQRGNVLELTSAQLSLQEAQARVGSASEAQADKMRGAQREVRDAIQGTKDAQQGQADAQKNVRNAIEGVTTAQQAQTRAQEAQQENLKKLGDLQDSTTGKLGLFAKVAGVSTEEFAKKFKDDAAGAMVLFVNGLERLQKEGVNVFPILDKLGLGEIRVRDSLLRLSGGQGILEQNLKEAAKAWEDNTELQRQAAIQNETTAAKLTILKNQIVDVLFTMGQDWLPVIKDVIEGLGPLAAVGVGIAKAFANLPGPVKIAIVAFLALVAAIGPVLIAIGFIATGLSGLIAIAPLVGAAVTLMLGPFGLAVLAFAAAFAAGLLIIKNWDSISEAAGKLKDKVLEGFQAVLDFLKNNWPEVATLISGPFAPLVILATDSFGIRSAIIQGFSGAINWLYNAGKAVITGFLGGLADKWEDVKDFFGNITDQIPRLKGPEQKDLALLAPAGRNVMQGFQNGLDEGWTGVQASLADKTAQLGALGSIGSLGRAGGSLTGLSAATGPGGGGGGSSVLAAIGGPRMGGGESMPIQINVGTVNTRGAGAKTGLRTLGWGVDQELQRRGVYTG